MDIHFPRAAVAVLAALVLSGCATSFPTSPDAFRTSATGTVAFRVDQPLAKAFEVVNGNRSVRAVQHDLRARLEKALGEPTIAPLSPNGVPA